MIQPDLPVRTALYELLTQLEYNGSSLQCFDENAPEDATFPCIVFTNAQNQPRLGSKDSFEGDNFIDVVVVHKSNVNDASKKSLDEVGALVVNALVPARGVFGINSNEAFVELFDVVHCRITDRTQAIPVPSGFHINKIFTVGHFLIQK